MPKNPAYDVLGGDTPGTTNTGEDYGADIEVSRASYECNYDYGNSMAGMSKRALKLGYGEAKPNP